MFSIGAGHTPSTITASASTPSTPNSRAFSSGMCLTFSFAIEPKITRLMSHRL